MIMCASVPIIIGCSRNNGGVMAQFSKTLTIQELNADSTFRFKTGYNRKTHDINIIVRHNKQYKYSQIPLIVKTIVNNATATIDTISLKLVQNNSKPGKTELWSGDSFAEYVSLKLPYRKNVAIKQYADVEMSVKLLVPQKYAQGIYFIGVNVTNALYPIDSTDNNNAEN